MIAVAEEDEEEEGDMEVEDVDTFSPGDERGAFISPGSERRSLISPGRERAAFVEEGDEDLQSGHGLSHVGRGLGLQDVVEKQEHLNGGGAVLDDGVVVEEADTGGVSLERVGTKDDERDEKQQKPKLAASPIP